MPKKFANMKGDERQWEIESAARTLKDFARIKKDKPLLAAARSRAPCINVASAMLVYFK